MRLLIFGFLIFSRLHGYSQDLSYARNILNTLCSPEFHGRGYVQSGDRKAAEFIADEFEKFDLEKVAPTYFQNFSLPINTFPGKLELKLGNKILQPGADYLVDPGSPSIRGTFETVTLSDDLMLNEEKFTAFINSSKNKFLVVTITDKKFSKEETTEIQDKLNLLKYGPNIPSRGTIIVSNEKLTWSGSTKQFSKPVFTVRTEKVPVAFSKVGVTIEAKFIADYKTQNIAGLLKGTSASDSLIIITAHYDHLGMMGKNTYFPGANDNASGTAMLLNLAKYYHQPEHRLKYSVLFIAFSAEEIGLLGSAYYTEHPLLPLAKTKFLLNFDLAGTGDDGIQVVNGSIYKARFAALKTLNDKGGFVKEVKTRGEACNSDHCLFYRKGVPCFFIYTLGGISAYHDINDKAETLPFTKFEGYFVLMTQFLSTI